MKVLLTPLLLAALLSVTVADDPDRDSFPDSLPDPGPPNVAPPRNSITALPPIPSRLPKPNPNPNNASRLDDGAPFSSDFGGVYLLVENNLDSSSPRYPVILISNKTSRQDGMHACSKLSSVGYIPSARGTNFTSLFANTPVASNEVANESSFWVGGLQSSNTTCRAMAKNGTLSSIPCDTQLPTLCLNLAPKAQFLMTRTNRQIKVQAPKAGTFQGYYDQNSFRFLGIRYAQSPVGDLRFREPQAYTPPANATEVQDATRYGSACIQLRSNDTTAAQAASFIMNQASENEDCLFLNVYTPSLRADASTPGLPVMVYIYGGGFLDNSGSTPLFEPGNVVSRGGVVVVSFNYRLGFLGTFQNKDGGIPASEAPGNLATRDQILALQWVRDNIEAFGGDPNRVTIFGESAGAYSIRALLTAPSAYSLYKNVIMQSDPLGLPLANATSMGYATNMTMQALGCSPSDIACARNKTVDEISAAQLKTVQGIDSPTSPYNWVAKEVFYRPAVDQDLIQGDLSQLAASNGPYNTNATIMWGFTHDDAGILIPIYLPLPVPPQSFNASVASLLPGFPGALFANASSVYPINTTDADGVRSMLSDAATDWYFRCPLFNVTRSLGSRSRLYSFEFDYGRQVPPVWPVRPSSFCNLPQRVCHGADIIPSFASANYFLAYPQTGVNARFARQIVDRFTTLAKTGTPNPTEDLPGYERLNPDVANVMLDPYTSSATNTVLFGATAGNVTQNLVKARCDYIEQNQHYLYEVYRS